MHDIIKRVYTFKMENLLYIKHVYKTNPGPFACFKKFPNLVRLFGISLYIWNSWKMSKFQSSNFKRRIYTNHSIWSIKREKKSWCSTKHSIMCISCNDGRTLSRRVTGIGLDDVCTSWNEVLQVSTMLPIMTRHNIT